MDREPDFEDERIRMWKMLQEPRQRPEAVDETVLAVDLENEEVYESRIYPLRPSPEMLTLIAVRRPEIVTAAGSPEDFLDAVRPIIEKSALKVLTKRSRSDGHITYLVAVAGPDVRVLLERGELPDEASFRRFVTNLEEDLLIPGVVGEPAVTPVEQWRRYELEDRAGPD